MTYITGGHSESRPCYLNPATPLTIKLLQILVIMSYILLL